MALTKSERLEAINNKYPNVLKNVKIGVVIWFLIFLITTILLAIAADSIPFYVPFIEIAIMLVWLGYYQQKNDGYYSEYNKIMNTEILKPYVYYLFALLALVFGFI